MGMGSRSRPIYGFMQPFGTPREYFPIRNSTL
jgi:hypothetical protein